jgi:phosphoglycolate phosphatase-like HAD superfamily hydrolase
MNRQVLVLLDMDGTLFNFKNISRYPDDPNKEVSRFELTMAAMTGKPLDDVRLTFRKDGMTDRTILMKMFEIHSISLDRLQEAMDLMDKIFAERMSKDYQFQRLPGVTSFLTNLRMRGVIIGLLTGALRKTGNLKLEEANILHYFKVRADSDDEHTDRAQLFSIAIKNAEQLGFTATATNGRYDNVFYIGDAPNDVISGCKVGVPTIIVGTGPWSEKGRWPADVKPELLVPNFIRGGNTILEFMSLI